MCYHFPRYHMISNLTRASFNFRLLDPRTLLSAALVSKKWLNLCRADSTLRKRIFQQIRHERRELLKPIPFKIERDNQSLPFSNLNGINRTPVPTGPSKSYSMHSLEPYVYPTVAQSCDTHFYKMHPSCDFSPSCEECTVNVLHSPHNI